MQRILSVLIVLSLAALAGCRSLSSCTGPADIGDGGQSIPTLRVPPGMVEPNQKDALVVPELNEPPRPRAENSGCIDQPPSYFPDRRPGAEAPAESNPPAPTRPAVPPQAEPPKFELPQGEPPQPEPSQAEPPRPDQPPG
jgi:hypothetical protein